MATVSHHHAAELAGWDWTALATIAVALVTLVVAAATFKTPGATKNLASETKISKRPLARLGGCTGS
jgi:hypothetical protein